MSNLHLSVQPLSASSSGAAPTLMPKRMKKKPNANANPNPNHSSIFKTSNVTPCTECGKQFNTWKALFGHMRCHPERQWRGMNQKSKLKPKPRLKQQAQQEELDWAHLTDEVTNAALILMQMSGWSFRDVFACIESCCERKVRNLCIDLNLPPPVEED